MYEIIKNVILSGVFKLADMKTKIDTLWVQGDLTEEQRNELVILMQENVKPESETPEQATLYKQILEDVYKRQRWICPVLMPRCGRQWVQIPSGYPALTEFPKLFRQGNMQDLRGRN